MANAITNQPGIFNSLVEGTKEGMNWLSTNAKNLSANAGDTLGRVWSAVSDFFSTVASKLSTWFQAGKDGVFAAKDQIMAMPTEGKVVGLVAVVGAALAGALIGKSWASAPAAAPAPAAAAAAAAAEEEVAAADPAAAAAAAADPAAAAAAAAAAPPV